MPLVEIQRHTEKGGGLKRFWKALSPFRSPLGMPTSKDQNQQNLPYLAVIYRISSRQEWVKITVNKITFKSPIGRQTQFTGNSWIMKLNDKKSFSGLQNGTWPTTEPQEVTVSNNSEKIPVGSYSRIVVTCVYTSLKTGFVCRRVKKTHELFNGSLPSQA